MGNGRNNKPNRKNKTKRLRQLAYVFCKNEHDQIVLDLAEEYRTMGYKTKVGKEYFDDEGRIIFEVDLLAKKEKELQVVEVKSRLTKDSSQKLIKQLSVRKSYFDKLGKYADYTKIYRGVTGPCL